MLGQLDCYNYMTSHTIVLKFAMISKTEDKSRNFTIFIKIFGKEKHAIDVSTSMTVFELKDKAEEKTGIPRQLQRLRYIDECDMENDARLSYYHLTAMAVIKMCFWPEWRPLIRAVMRGDLPEVSSLITDNGLERTLPMKCDVRRCSTIHIVGGILSCGISARRKSVSLPRITSRIEPSSADKGSVALFIAAQRGHDVIVQTLMDANVRAFESQPSGRTPLLMAAKNSRVETVDLLLGRTRSVIHSSQYETVRERTLKSLVALLEKKGAGKKLWFTMNHMKVNKVERECHPNNSLLRQHQMHDSTTPVWRKAKVCHFATISRMSKTRLGDDLVKIAKGNVVTEYLQSLTKLPRVARGFSIEAELRMSTNGRGIGVFAAEFLPAGSRIDTDREHVSFTREQAYAFLEAVPTQEHRKWWLEHIYCLDGLMKVDMTELDTMMINHSDNPTVITREDGYDYTTRDVNIGEELTEDYTTYDTVRYYDELCKKYGVDHFNSKWK